MVQSLRLIHAEHDRGFGAEQDAETLPWAALARAERMRTDDPLVAEPVLGCPEPGKINADGDRIEFIPELEIGQALQQVFGIIGGDIGMGDLLAQDPLGRGDLDELAAVAAVVHSQILAFHHPVGQRFLRITVSRADIDRIIHPKTLKCLPFIHPAEIMLQIVIHPAMHLARQPVRPPVRQRRQQPFPGCHL